MPPEAPAVPALVLPGAPDALGVPAPAVLEPGANAGPAVVPAAAPAPLPHYPPPAPAGAAGPLAAIGPAAVVIPAAPEAVDAGGPAQAVIGFYSLAGSGQFDGAARLWTPRMAAAYPPGENITRRFSQTRRLTVQRAQTVSLDARAGRATVAVDVLEVVGAPPVTRRYTGTWHLVRGAGGWLLDQPNLRLG